MLSTLHLADAGTMPFGESYIGRHSTAPVTIPSVSPTSAIENDNFRQVISSELFAS